MSLYKYLSEDRISILLTGLIRFTQPQAFNDPFELKPHISSIADPAELESKLDENFESILKEEYETLPTEVKMILSYDIFKQYANSKREEVLKGMISLADQAAPMLEESIHSAFENKIGILSLTEKPSNLLMWSHYANSHNGFVVEFDETHPFFNSRKGKHDELRYCRKVSYSQNRPSIKLFSLENLDSFLIKGKEWEYEQEWRMMLPLENADHTIEQSPYNIYLFKIPFTTIKSVIIGHRTSDSIKNEIIDSIKLNNELTHVSIIFAKADSKEFTLNFLTEDI